MIERTKEVSSSCKGGRLLTGSQEEWSRSDFQGNSMLSFFKRARWAILLPILQGTIFLISGVLEHRKVIDPYGDLGMTWYGCNQLYYRALPEEAKQREFVAVTIYCRPAFYPRVVALTNFPVFAISGASSWFLSYYVVVNQALLFYGINGIGIPLFWFWIGTRIDRRLRRQEATTSA